VTPSGVIRPLPPHVERADTDLSSADATGTGRFEPKPELDLNGVVEPALAKALLLAAEAQRWEIVEQIARELKERRETLNGKRAELSTSRSSEPRRPVPRTNGPAIARRECARRPR
jgi:hypothetical protein